MNVHVELTYRLFYSTEPHTGSHGEVTAVLVQPSGTVISDEMYRVALKHVSQMNTDILARDLTPNKDPK